MKVLIIGGSGLVGGNLNKLISKDGFYTKILATHLNFEGDETVFYDPSAEPPDYITNTKWDVIVHTGALTNVDLCETEVELSYKSTVSSTQLLLDLAKQNGAKFLYISTDYVFDGKSGPYSEHDAVNPLNVYGKHKLEAETIAAGYHDHLILRITNVYGDEIRKKNFIARVVNDLESKERLTINAPVDQFATPLNAYDLAKAIDLLIKDNKRGIYHIASTDYMSRVQLLQRINKHFNNRIDIKPIKTAELKQVALRPLSGGLLTFKFMGEYPEFNFSNVDDYINNK